MATYGIDEYGKNRTDIYPVGSIYLSVVDTNPGALFGGTWERIKDRFLLAAGDTYTAGSSGGEATHTLTVNEIPSHNHKYLTAPSYHSASEGTSQYFAGTEETELDTSNAGGGQAHNNMPPYLTVYVWKRIS